jgi:hypothetical protein
MATLKAIKPTVAQVHAKILDATHDPKKNSDAVDAIKAFGIDAFFCVYSEYLDDINPNLIRHFVFATKLYHSSKQHWRRVQ